MSHDQCASMERHHYGAHLGVVVMVNVRLDVQTADLFVSHGFLFKLVGGFQVDAEPEREDVGRREEENSDFHFETEVISRIVSESWRISAYLAGGMADLMTQSKQYSIHCGK